MKKYSSQKNVKGKVSFRTPSRFIYKMTLKKKRVNKGKNS